ncbi:dual specificity protein phosphatase 19 isoform X2 [Ambystoma mexicanum]|uniref:dual specificity protein phosphatase 19 isoform X2 n=1 Tax=Ambystoma mexicanum TaxID=8296 RepID=UPI0037E7789A
MHSLTHEIEGFSKTNLRKQCTRVTTVTGRRMVESWRDSLLHVEEDSGPDQEDVCGYVQDLSLDLQIGTVRPWLLLGSQDAAQDLDTLKKYKVSHILNVAWGVANAFPDDFICKSIPILDLPETNITSYFLECFDFIQQAKIEAELRGGPSRGEITLWMLRKLYPQQDPSWGSTGTDTLMDS